MIALIQRVLAASVQVEGRQIAAIGAGMLALIGIEHEDGASSMKRLLQRLLDYRIFEDAVGRMNLSLRDTGGALLLVPQFTLAADTRSGNRPGFASAAAPAVARPLFEQMIEHARALHPQVAAGRFGAHMQLSSTNDGPVTFWLTSGPARRQTAGAPEQ